MRIIIADDEPLARKRLARQLAEIPGCLLIGEASNGQEAILRCDELQPDILLLDIRMPEMDGLQAAQHLSQLEQPPAIIFTTAFDSHALAAFETCAVAYLLKPVRREQLQLAIEKAQKLNRVQLVQIDTLQHPAEEQEHLTVQVGNTTQLIPINEIDFFRAEQKYVVIYRGAEQYLLEVSLKSLEERFTHRFVRIHRNALVAIKAISALQRDDKGHYQMLLHNQKEPLEVSRRLVSQLKEKIKNNTQ